LLYALRRYDDAIAAAGRAIELDPRRAASYHQRGLDYSGSGRHAQAIPDYTRSIELDPNSAAAYHNRGWAFLELGRLDESLADLKKSLELDPANTAALSHLSRLHMTRKQYTEAVADCDAALMVSPALTWAIDRKAEAQRLLGVPAPSSLSAPKLLSPAAEPCSSTIRGRPRWCGERWRARRRTLCSGSIRTMAAGVRTASGVRLLRCA